jgi:hypothetical protein
MGVRRSPTVRDLAGNHRLDSEAARKHRNREPQ